MKNSNEQRVSMSTFGKLILLWAFIPIVWGLKIHKKGMKKRWVFLLMMISPMNILIALHILLLYLIIYVDMAIKHGSFLWFC